MDKWVEGGSEGGMNEWVDGQIIGWMEGGSEGGMNGWMDGVREGGMNGWMDKWVDGWKSEWMDIDRLMYSDYVTCYIRSLYTDHHAKFLPLMSMVYLFCVYVFIVRKSNRK